jgi:penicillin-binding protein 1A
MAKDGKLDADAAGRAEPPPMKLDFERQAEPLGLAPHVAQQLRKWLIDWADRQRLRHPCRRTGGAHHHRLRLQVMANQAVARQGDRCRGWPCRQWGPRGGFAPNRALVQALLRETPQYKAAREAGLDDAQALASAWRAMQTLMKALRRRKDPPVRRLHGAGSAQRPGAAWVGSRDFCERPVRPCGSRRGASRAPPSSRLSMARRSSRA